jgi:hemolysin III
MTAGNVEELVQVWWHRGRAVTRAEKIADAIVHGFGLVVALVAGSALLTIALIKTAPTAFPALLVYVASLVLLLSVSMAFNLWPRTTVKMVLARLDQAAIFLFIAATYTPFLSLMWGTPQGLGLTIFVWSAALIGIALKLIVPMHFGRLAIVLYLAIGWSGIIVFQGLAEALPTSALWLLVAGGLTYSVGIIFHLWEKLQFHRALWHTFVVVGASLHLIALFDAMVVSRW